MSFKISILILIALSLAAACTRHSVGTRSGLLAIRPLHKYQAKDTSVAPDYKDSTLSGKLSSFENKKLNIKYIGPISRFEKQILSKNL